MGSGLGFFHDLRNKYYDLQLEMINLDLEVKNKILDIKYDEKEREKAIKLAKTVATQAAKQIIKKTL